MIYIRHIPVCRIFFGEHMEKQFFLFKFRKTSNIDTLERMYEHMRDKVDDNDVAFFLGAYDHRKAELAVGRIFDKVPASAWKYVK